MSPFRINQFSCICPAGVDLFLCNAVKGPSNAFPAIDKILRNDRVDRLFCADRWEAQPFSKRLGNGSGYRGNQMDP